MQLEREATYYEPMRLSKYPVEWQEIVKEISTDDLKKSSEI